MSEITHDPSRPRIIHVSETASTNADAWRLARAGEDLPLWLRADWQTAGRGRAGRNWTSVKGNVFVSCALNCAVAPDRAGQLALVAGLALYDTAAHLAPKLARGANSPGLRLKWPNDLLVDGRKLAGILVECGSLPAHDGLVAVVGFGLNLAAAPVGVGQPTASLDQFGADIDPEAAVQTLAGYFAEWLARWANGAGFEDDIVAAWLARAGPIGEEMTIRGSAGDVQGTFAGLDGRGFLLLETEGGRIQTISHGDVALARGLESEGS